MSFTLCNFYIKITFLMFWLTIIDKDSIKGFTKNTVLRNYHTKERCVPDGKLFILQSRKIKHSRIIDLIKGDVIGLRTSSTVILVNRFVGSSPEGINEVFQSFNRLFTLCDCLRPGGFYSMCYLKHSRCGRWKVSPLLKCYKFYLYIYYSTTRRKSLILTLWRVLPSIVSITKNKN